ncbi:hypothetical protein M885DRAFT_520353 [Pelagophyceae sp. CCMP2097]|nr:hypothetical protein M885DRAFT_520353 [Pelagophyceae sp. CCMP2097]
MRVLALVLLAGAAQAFAPSAVARRTVAVQAEKEAKPDYSTFAADALENELRSAHHRLLELRLEKQQQAKRANYKSSEVRALKAKVSRIMPFYEAQAEAKAEAAAAVAEVPASA